MTGPKGSVYAGEKYHLRLKFSKEYPSKPPSAFFLKPNIPQHSHVYSNGDICLSVTGTGWRPNMTAESVIVSILSMLSGAKRKCVPHSSDTGVESDPGKEQSWSYHDDNC